MFRRNKEFTLHRVHDKITIREGDEKLDLKVDGDAMRMATGLINAQAMLKKLNQESKEEDFIEAGRYFARVIFGEEQAKALEEFYRGDAGCMITLCGTYFSKRLSKLITEAQKK